MNAIKSIEYKNHTISIYYDNNTFNNPIECDNLGTMALYHKRYTLGDDTKLDIEEAHEIEISDKFICLPVYMYDHSGITINTTGFICPWDSGKLGIIFVSKEKAKKEYNVSRISKGKRELIERVLRGEVETYDQFLRGEVYGFKVFDQNNEEIDSCWGWGYYDLKHLECDARATIDYQVRTYGEQLELSI